MSNYIGNSWTVVCHLRVEEFSVTMQTPVPRFSPSAYYRVFPAWLLGNGLLSWGLMDEA